MTSFVKKFANAVNTNKYLACVFLDLSKAFDALGHAIFLYKLEAYGITAAAHKWISDYFSNRKQLAQVEESKSCLCNQICGVPQGFTFWATTSYSLYKRFTNVTCSNTHSSMLFADDTSVYFQSKRT